MDTTKEPRELAADGAMTVIEAARWLGVSRSTLYELLGGGGIRALRIGRRRLVPREALRAYLAERLADGTAEQPRPAA
jgi:excisionase family DNA binding protein